MVVHAGPTTDRESPAGLRSHGSRRRTRIRKSQGGDIATVYNINEDTYRQHFRTAKLKAGEIPRELAIRLRDLADRWTKASTDSTDATDILDIFVKEQLINTMPEDVRLWVRKHKPKTSEEAGQLAEDFIQAGQPLTQTTTRAAPRGERPPPPGKCPRCGKEGHWVRDCPKARAGGPPLPREQAAKPEREPGPSRCFHCQQRGHFAAHCPNNATLYCEGEDKSSVDVSAPHQGEKGIFRRGVVDGVYIKDILLDTGASRSMIREDILPPDHRVDGEVTIRCAHGDMVAYPLTAIAMDIGSRRFVVKAGVSRTLPVPVLLGRDVPELLQLLEGESSTTPEPQESETEDVLAATTRVQERRRENEAALIQAREQDDGARASPVHVAHEGATEVTRWCELDDSLFSPSSRPGRPRMSRRQRRENNRLYVEGATERSGASPTPQEATERSGASPTPQVLDLTSIELQRLQEEDVTLEAARRMAKGEPGLAGNDFFLRNGLLRRVVSAAHTADKLLAACKDLPKSHGVLT